MRTIKIAVLIALGITASLPTYAQYFGGLPLGAVRGTIPADASNLLFGSRFFSSASASGNGGGDLKFGYRFSSSLLQHIALVGQYAEAPRWSGEQISLGGTRAIQKTTTYGLDLVSTMPLFERLSLTGSAGVARVGADSVFGGAVPIGLLANNETRYTSAGRVGIGLQYDFNRSLGLRFGVERYRNLNGNTSSGGNLDADTFAFGVRIRF